MQTRMTHLTRTQVRRIDQLAVERYAMPSIILMENAARSATEQAIHMLQDRPGASVLIACGSGNNGGDGLAIARHLHNHGFTVHVALAGDPSRLTDDATTNLRIVQAMKLPLLDARQGLTIPSGTALIIDALLGTGLTQAPRSPYDLIIRSINESQIPVLAVDLPSGLDCDTGRPLGPACVRATRTITFVALKSGFSNPQSGAYTGPVVVGDIGCPRELIEWVLQEPHARM